MEVVRQAWAVMASAGRVHSCCVGAKARILTRSNVHHCRAMSAGEEGRYRTARHELLKMIPHTDDAVALVRTQLLCTLRGNAPPCHTADTCAAASVTDLLPDVVASAGGAFRSGTSVREVVSPSWPRG